MQQSCIQFVAVLAFGHFVFILYDDPAHYVVCVDLKHECADTDARCFQAARVSDSDLYIAGQPVEDDEGSGIHKLSLPDLVGA